MARVCINEFIVLHAKWKNIRPNTNLKGEMKERKCMSVYICVYACLSNENGCKIDTPVDIIQSKDGCLVLFWYILAWVVIAIQINWITYRDRECWARESFTMLFISFHSVLL